MLTTLRRLRDDERGAFLALFAVLALALLLGTAFVLDIANLQEHDRHLQLQVDNGALASGPEFSGCFTGAEAVAKTNIEARVRQYGGDPAVSASYNKQVDDPGRVSLRLNGDDYPLGGTDWLMDVDEDGDSEPADPCETKFIDVKASDLGIPSFFGRLLPDGVNPFDAHARARVEIFKLHEFEGILPWAVPEFDPTTMAVIFVNEETGAVLSTQLLEKDGNQTQNGTTVTVWDADAQIGDPTDGTGLPQRTGAIILTSKSPSDDISFSGTLAEICSAGNGNDTRCFSGSSATSGLFFFRGFPETTPPGTAAAPQLLDVEVRTVPTGCSESSAPYYMLVADCDIQVRAKIDFGTGIADPTVDPPRARVDLDGTNMTWTAADGGWFAATLDVPAGDGRQGPYTIHWQTGTGSARVQGDFLHAAHPYAANPAAGPVDYLEITSDAGIADHTFQIGSNPVVHVEVGIQPALDLAVAGEDPIVLRLGSPSGSRNQAIDCDANRRFDEEILTGCFTPYTDNPTGDCTPYTETPGLPLPPPTTNPSPVPNCAAVETGDKIGQLRKGIHDRWETTCEDNPNNWPDDPTPDNVPGFDDPRWVVLLITDLGTFTDSGGGVVPIRKIAGFYVTGWDISPQTDGCDDNDPHPLGADDQDDNGDVWGYFVVKVVPNPTGSTPTETCEFDELGICVSVLTR
jgi:hypothetical protein